MRVLILATRPTDPRRGDPSATPLLIRAFSERGHAVDLVCGGQEPLRSFDTLTVWPVHAARTHGVPGFAGRVFEASRAARPDLVIAQRSHFALGRLVATRANAAFVPMFDEASLDIAPVRRALTAFDARLVRTTGACIAFGPLRAEEAFRFGAQRVIELPRVAGLSPENRPATGWLRRHLGIDGGMLAVAWGELGPEHGTDVLIEGVKVAADADADVHAAIFGGDRTTQDRYEAKAERLGIHNRVHLLGSWPASKLGTLLPEADAVVDASTQAERTPRVLYSALAAARPVILAEVPGRERLVEPGACLLAPPDRLGVGHALSELALHPDARARYGSSGLAAAEAGHTFESFAAASIEPLEQIASQAQAARGSPSRRPQGLGA